MCPPHPSLGNPMLSPPQYPGWPCLAWEGSTWAWAPGSEGHGAVLEAAPAHAVVFDDSFLLDWEAAAMIYHVCALCW